MNRFSVALIVVFLNFAVEEILGVSWPWADPLLTLVVLYAFFHNLDVRSFLFYALYCGLLKEFLSSDVFGVHMVSYALCAYLVSWSSRLLYKENWIFVLPAVFLAGFLDYAFVLTCGSVGVAARGGVGASGLFIKLAVQSAGSALFAFLFYRFCRRCVFEFIE